MVVIAYQKRMAMGTKTGYGFIFLYFCFVAMQFIVDRSEHIPQATQTDAGP